MTSLTFTKGHSAGSDAILIIDREGERSLSPETIRFLTSRRFGVGADAVIRIVPSASLEAGREVLEVAPDAEWFMDVWGADGEPAETIGDAARLTAHLLVDEGLVAPERRDTVAVATRVGVCDVLPGVAGYTVDLGRWRLAGEPLVSARGLYVARPALGIALNGGHAVTALANGGELDAVNLSEAPTLDPATVAATEFVVPEDPLVKDGVARIRMRVHDPVLGELPASAEAAAVAALAIRHWGGEGMPNHWSVESLGGRLTVRMFPTEEGEHVSVGGPTRLIATGTIDAETLEGAAG